MTCADAADRILDHLYGEIAGSDRDAFQAHLAGCESCRGELESMERTRRTARLALDGPLSAPAPERVRREVLAAAELAVRQRGMVPAAAAAGGARALSPGGDKGRASQAAPSREGFWAWLRRPWFLPAFATVSLLAIFFIARPAIMDGPRQVLEERLAERAVPQAATSAKTPATAPAPEAESTAPSDKAADEERPAGGPKGAALRDADEQDVPRAAPAIRADLRSRATAVGAGDTGRGADGLPRPGRRSAERLQAERAMARDTATRAAGASNRFAQPPPPVVVQPKPATRVVLRPAQDPSFRQDVPKAELQEPMAAAPEPSPVRAEADSAGFRMESRAKKLSAPRLADDQALGLEAEGKSAGAGASARASAPSASRAPAAPPTPPPAPMEAAVPASAPVASAGAPAKERAGETAAREHAAPDKRRSPDEEAAFQRALLAILLERGDRAYAEGRWQAAADIYRDLLRRFASDPRAKDWQRRRDTALANLRR